MRPGDEVVTQVGTYWEVLSSLLVHGYAVKRWIVTRSGSNYEMRGRWVKGRRYLWTNPLTGVQQGYFFDYLSPFYVGKEK